MVHPPGRAPLDLVITADDATSAIYSAKFSERVIKVQSVGPQARALTTAQVFLDLSQAGRGGADLVNGFAGQDVLE
jgi:hypothetical protein